MAQDSNFPPRRLVTRLTSFTPLARLTSFTPLARTVTPSPPERSERSNTAAPSRATEKDGSRRRRSLLVGAYVALGAGVSLAAAGAVSHGRHAPKLYLPSDKPIVLNSGTANIKQTVEGSQVRWRRTETTVVLDPTLEAFGPETRDAVRNAFGSWLESDADLPRLTFETSDRKSAPLTPDGKNSVVVAPITLEGHENDLAITLTRLDEATGGISEADVVLNAKFVFKNFERKRGDHGNRNDGDDGRRDSDSDSDEESRPRSEQRSTCVAQDGDGECSEKVYDVQNVVTHEVGHFFGLGEDMTDTAATMYRCTNRCETHKRELTDDDKSVMALLYQPGAAENAESEPVGGCGGARVATHGNPGQAAWGLVAALAWIARRRRVA